ncbi:MAG: hypothetical protein JSS61_02860 [Verrucomicrobia bacterium]|nr:hypothetical protein [Verrucomicrobiota bacterium]
MIILPSPRLSVDRWLFRGIRVAAVAVAAAGLFLLIYFFIYPWKTGENARFRMGSNERRGVPSYAYEAIGTGALTLNPRHALGWVSRIADELVLIAYNSRPDINPAESTLLLSFKHGKEQIFHPNGKTLFLQENTQGRGLLPSQEITSLWVKPILMENGSVLVEAGRKIVSSEGKEGEERGQFFLAQQGGVPAQFNPVQHPFVREFQAAKVFFRDLLIQKYGGREYAPWRERAVIEFASGSATYACFVSPGDYLKYVGGEWTLCSKEELEREVPIARVKVAAEGRLEAEVWDAMGYYALPIQLESKRIVAELLKPEALLTGIRLRNGTQVSGALGKRRMILKQGDWLLKTQTGWRNLRRTEEITNYLYRRLKGDLFIFDAIEKEGGRYLLKGNLFDETRTQSEPFALAIEGDAKQGKAARKKKPAATRKAA